MKKLNGEQAAELLFNWLQIAKPDFGDDDLKTIENLPEWLPIATDLALHLAENPSADISAWPWQARCLCHTQVANWMGYAMSPQCAAVSLPIDNHDLDNPTDTLRWLIRNQIAPMSVFYTLGS